MAQPAEHASPSSGSGSKRPKAAQPIHKRLLFGLAAASIQNVIVGPAMTYRNLKQRILPPFTYPTVIKTYESRPKLPVRIFFPKSYNPKTPRPLPLLLTIHGGGFVVGDPSDNDVWNSSFCEAHSALVIALNYAKAPANPFPGPRLDLEAQIAAVFADPELTPHIDPAKVGMLGFSAGGSLTMTVSGTPAVRDKITAGIVPIYPVTDLSVAAELKAETRRYKPKLGGTRARDNDSLLKMAGIFDWCCKCLWPYLVKSAHHLILHADIPVGQDTCDPLLSALYAKRSDFPKRMWFVGCELDMLGHEAWRAACKFAGKTVPGMDQRIGQEEVASGGKAGTLITTGDERFAFNVKDQDGEVKWLCVPDAAHGFDMAANMGADKEEVRDGELKRDALIQMTGEWLFGQ